MRPQVLTVSAFGPYAGEITIDFERLWGRRDFIWLLEIPGAGKNKHF